MDVDPFHGQFSTTLRSEDFVFFEAELTAVIDHQGQVARLRTMEEGLDIDIRRHADATVEVTGTARSHPAMGSALAFRLDGLEPADLAALRDQVATVVAEFPPRTPPDDEDAVPPEWNESLGPAEDPSVLRRHLRRHVQRDPTCPFCADVGDTVVAVMRMDAHGDPWNPIEVGEHGVVTEILRATGCLPFTNRLGTDEVFVTFDNEDRWTLCGPRDLLHVTRRRHR